MIVHQYLCSKKFTRLDLEGLQANLIWRCDLRREFPSEPYLVSLKQTHKGSIVGVPSEVRVQLSGFLHASQLLWRLFSSNQRLVQWHGVMSVPYETLPL